MPVSKNMIQEKCEQIEARFPYRVNEVKSAISRLESNELIGDEKVQLFAKRLYQCRIWAQFTVEDAAQVLGVSHVTVLKYENAKNRRSKIDKNYLELFALIYGVSPLFLVGKTNNPFDYEGDLPFEEMLSFPPMQLQEYLYGSQFRPQSDIERCAVAVIDRLYCDFPYVEKEEQNLMEIFLKVCDAKHHRRNIIKSQLIGIPRIKKIVTPATNKEAYNTNKNRCGYVTSGNVDKDNCLKGLGRFFSDIRKQNDRHVQECYNYLVELGTKDLELLQYFAKISGAPPNVRQFVAKFLTEGGFLEDDYAFGQNDRKEKLQSYCGIEVTFWHDE